MRRSLLSTLALLLLFGCSLPAFPQDSPPPASEPEQSEVIRSFDSLIALRSDGTMHVTEIIRVVALNERINHGIFRDFPTKYKDQWGNRYHVAFDVVGAARDGHDEPYHTETLDNGVRVYMGSKDMLVTPGEHTYELTYETSRQVGFFADHDELYWNVTGNGWIFPIEHATAEVTLPPGVAREQVTVTGYTGAQGSRAQDFSGEVDAHGVSRFVTKHPLGPQEGLTIVVMFPKGLVTAPSLQQKLMWFLGDNAPAMAAFIGLLVTLLYQIAAWFAVGRDPEPGPIVVRYEAPQVLSPGAVRYLKKMKYDDKIFSALVVDMGVKRYLRIDQDAEGAFTLTKESGAVEGPGVATFSAMKLSPEEKLIADSLFSSGSTCELKQANHTRIKTAIDAVKKQLAQAMEQRYFLTNSRYLWPSVALTIATFIAVLAVSGSSGAPVAIFMTVWLAGWSVGVAALSLAVASAWRAAWHSHGWGKLSYGGALFITAFSVPFFIGEFFGLGMFARSTSVVATLALIVLALSNFIFHELLKSPTNAGRALLDQIDGFREFIGATEDTERKYPLERSPATFEKFLPYAMALDLEEVWTAKFQSVIAAASAAGAATSSGYSPAWASFSGASALSGLGAFSDLGSALGSAVSSSSSAPGSSSGGGGGGSSGGGGGGGGGGGW